MPGIFGINKGFTLIELLVVIAILGILASTVVINLNPAANLAQTRDARRIADLSSIKQAMELYVLDNGKYPQGVDGTEDLMVLVPNHLASIPLDPTNRGEYVYSICSGATGKEFAIGAKLETIKYKNTAGNVLPCKPNGAAYIGEACPPIESNYYCTSGKQY